MLSVESMPPTPPLQVVLTESTVNIRHLRQLKTQRVPRLSYHVPYVLFTETGGHQVVEDNMLKRKGFTLGAW